ncbi:MAG: tetratricopeptide repeat protein [Pseudomonadota bacterium]
MRTPLFACLFLIAAPVFAADPNDGEDVTRSAEYMEAEALVAAEAYSLALEKLKELAVAEPENADVFNLLGFAARHEDDYVEAEEAYNRALTLNPNHRGALEYQGEMYLVLEDPARAEANLDRLEALCPAGCEERAELRAAIETWRKERGS